MWGRQRPFVGGQDFVEAEPLRRLRPPQTGAVEGGLDAPAGTRPLQGIGERHAGNGAGQRFRAIPLLWKTGKRNPESVGSSAEIPDK